jgi:hypothetical protein
MMYTIGHTENYLKVLRQPGTQVLKNVGGYVFLTQDEAERRIAEEGQTGNWSVFGLKADPSQIKPSENGWWHELIEQAEVVLLEG